MKSLRTVLILLLSVMLTTSCENPNALTEYSKTDSDEALYVDAKQRIDKSDWAGAITILTTSLSPDFRNRTAVRETLMHAYGGKCGIAFLDLVHSLKSVNSNNMFLIAMRLFQGKVVDAAACDAAIDVLQSLGATATQRTKNQNMFAAILGISRMGATLKSKLDIDGGGVGDGTVDGTPNFCDTSSGPHLTDADVNRIASGVALIFENISVLGDELAGGGATDAFDEAQDLCESPPALPALPTLGTPASHGLPFANWTDVGFPTNTPTLQDLGLPADLSEPYNCLATKTADVRPKMQRLFRRMIASDLGLGSCNLSNMAVSLELTGGPGNRPYIKVDMNCCPGLLKP